MFSFNPLKLFTRARFIYIHKVSSVSCFHYFSTEKHFKTDMQENETVLTKVKVSHFSFHVKD